MNEWTNTNLCSSCRFHNNNKKEKEKIIFEYIKPTTTNKQQQQTKQQLKREIYVMCQKECIFKKECVQILFGRENHR